MLIDLKPSGAHYMEHFHHAGGVPKLMAQLGDLIELEAKTITGAHAARVVAARRGGAGQDVIGSREKPIEPKAAWPCCMAILRRAAPSSSNRRRPGELLQHTGRAVVFESVEDMTLRVDDPGLEVNADDVLVLRNAGPKGAPGMPEAGYIPIPKKLARGGVKDMVRISDGRMSGTASARSCAHHAGTAVGGPLALVRTGDMIRLDVAKRSIDCWWTPLSSKRAARRSNCRRPNEQNPVRASVQRNHFAGRRRLRFRLSAPPGRVKGKH